MHMLIGDYLKTCGETVDLWNTLLYDSFLLIALSFLELDIENLIPLTSYVFSSILSTKQTCHSGSGSPSLETCHR